jgi:hypothetical protein
MPCPSHPPWLDHFNYTCSFLQPLVTSSLFGPNIFPSTLFSNTLSLCSPLYQGPSFTPLQKNHTQNYSFVYFNFYVFRQQTRGRKVLDWMVASITKFNLLLISLLNQVLIC